MVCILGDFFSIFVQLHNKTTATKEQLTCMTYNCISMHQTGEHSMEISENVIQIKNQTIFNIFILIGKVSH